VNTPGPTSAAPRRYAAFISYSHVDRDTARWLHRAIENYRLPEHLRDQVTRSGRSSGRLSPVFLDRADLPTSTDLAESVRVALEESDALIVVCSPTAARSRWVNEEVRLFRAMGRGDRILCLIVSGEPRAADKGFPPDEECLPPALRFVVTDGLVTDVPAPEPLAADLRHAADTRRDAKLKLIAALLGTGLDDLRRRDQARRQRQVAMVLTGSMVLSVAFAALAVAALLQRNEAERQRKLAEQKSLTAERTADFMISLFKVSDPSEARGNAVTAREILDRGARQIDQSLRAEPQVRAQLSTTLGEVYTGLGLYNPAFELLTKAGEIPEQDSVSHLRQTIALGELEFQRGNDARAAALLRSANDLANGLDNEAAPSLRARILLDRGDVAAFMERADDARGFFSPALQIGKQHGLDDVITRAVTALPRASLGSDTRNSEIMKSAVRSAVSVFCSATRRARSASLRAINANSARPANRMQPATETAPTAARRRCLRAWSRRRNSSSPAPSMPAMILSFASRFVSPPVRRSAASGSGAG
jgi:hypothetical protein